MRRDIFVICDMEIKSIRKAKKLTGKKVLLRADFNVPVNIKGEVKDDFKILASLPTIRFLLRYKCRIIIITHLGRPQSNSDSKIKKVKCCSVKHIGAHLSRLLNKKVKFINDCVGFKVGTEVSKIKAGEILILENLRFHKAEMENSKKFARELASLADIYVNDAFGVSHRKHASLSAIKNYIPSYAGILLENEVKNLSKALNPKQPLLTVLGGAKLATKISLIKNLHKKSFRILIGGALASIFFAAHNLEIGKSLIDKASVKLAKKFKDKSIILPIDVIVSDSSMEKAQVKSISGINKNDIILDIGPQTIKLYSSYIRKAKTIIWNGPMGMFENERFKHGTLGIACAIASRSVGQAYGIAGGGETVKALRAMKMIDYIDWVSTGGGAMLAFLGKERLPGLNKIVN